MDSSSYLDKFQKATNLMDKKLLNKKEVEIAVVMYGEDCVVLKLYKRSWTNQPQDPMTSISRIFFSIWINTSMKAEKKIFYNIHALKLRQLKDYSIQSKKFAERFRESFKIFEHNWKNVSVNFGPLTLMQGWLKLSPEKLQGDVLNLAKNFLEIEHIIDDTLAKFK